jgi:threonine/homoserine/homoserine lactone efflux protein
MVIGAKYLLGSFRAEPVVAREPRSNRSAVFLGFFTSIANPQSALSTTSLFAATMPPQPAISLGLGAVAVMTFVAISWYGFVACALTTRPAAAAFLRLRRWIDRVAGLAFLVFGTRLALER